MLAWVRGLGRIQSLARYPLSFFAAGNADATYTEVRAGAARSVSGKSLPEMARPVHGIETSVLLLQNHNITHSVTCQCFLPLLEFYLKTAERETKNRRLWAVFLLRLSLFVKD